MERDQARADPMLEGAPVPVLIRIAEDPSTYFNFCAGQGEPLTDPDQMMQREWGEGHYTGCPVYAAAREMDHISDRLFAPEREPEVDPDLPGVKMESGLATDEEVNWLMGERVL